MLPKATIKFWQSLQEKKQRENYGLCVVEGERIVAEALSSGWEVEEVLLTKPLASLETLLDTVSHHYIQEEEMRRITAVQSPPPAAALVKIPLVTLNTLTSAPGNIVALDGVADPGNVGTIIRTADWFGAKGIIVTEGTADPYSDKVLRAAMGSHFHLPIFRTANLPEDLQKFRHANYAIVVTSVQSTATNAITDPFCLILGNEARGVSQTVAECATTYYHIPGLGKAESLNVAASAAIALFDLTR